MKETQDDDDDDGGNKMKRIRYRERQRQKIEKERERAEGVREMEKDFEFANWLEFLLENLVFLCIKGHKFSGVSFFSHSFTWKIKPS